MKKQFGVNINFTVDAEDESVDVGSIVSVLSKAPAIAGCTARVSGVNVYDQTADCPPSLAGGRVPAPTPVDDEEAKAAEESEEERHARLSDY